MPQETLVAPFRLTFLSTVAGITHKRQCFLNAIASGDASGYDTVARATFGAVGISGLAGHYFTLIAPYYKASDTSFDGWILEQRSGTTWIYVSSGSTVVVPSGATVYSPSMMFDCVGKNTNNHVVHNPMYEGAFGTPSKIKDYATASATLKGIIDFYFNVGLGAGNQDAWAWKRSRGGFYANRWLSVVIDSNEKLRRLRRIK